MRRAAVIAAVLGLAGCAMATETADMLARDQAKAVINGVVAERLPGVNVAPVTDCIVDNATTSEIVTIAGTTVTGVTPEAVRMVVGVAQRPETVQCIAGTGFGGLGGVLL